MLVEVRKEDLSVATDSRGLAGLIYGLLSRFTSKREHLHFDVGQTSYCQHKVKRIYIEVD